MSKRIKGYFVTLLMILSFSLITIASMGYLPVFAVRILKLIALCLAACAVRFLFKKAKWLWDESEKCR